MEIFHSKLQLYHINWTAILEILVIPLSFEDYYIKIQSPWPIGVPRDYFMVDRF